MLKNESDKDNQIMEIYYLVSEIMIEICNGTTDVLLIQTITNYFRFYLPICREIVIHK